MVRTNIARAALVMAIIVILACGATYFGTEDDYKIAKGESAEHIIQSIQINPFNYDENYKTDEHKELETKRIICIIVGVGAVAVAIFSVVVIKSQDNENEYAANNEAPNPNNSNSSSISISDEIMKLYNLKNRGILTQEEYESQKKQLLNNSDE